MNNPVFFKNLTDNLALSAFFVSVILRVSMFFATTGIGKWSHDHWIFTICYLPPRHILEWVEKWKSNSGRSKRPHNLTKREKEILAPYIAENSDFRTIRFLYSEPVARGLADDGVLYIPNIERNPNDYAAYNIHDCVIQF